MLALAAILVASAQQTTPVAWKHTLIRHERFEDFEKGSGVCARMDAYGPLWLAPRPRARDHLGNWFEESECELARFESVAIEIPGGFEELVFSWNVRVPHDVGFALDARVAAGDGGAWSPWLEVVHSGAAIPEVRPAQDVPSSEDLLEFSDELARPAFDGGRVESARFNSTRVWHRVQYRVRARYDQKAPGDAVVRVRRVVVVASRRGEAAAASSLVAMNPAAVRRLKFPVWHVGGSEPEDGAPLSLFSSVSAAVVHRGARLGGLDEVLGEMHVDPMGLAPSAFVHAAYELQVPGYFARYSSWRDIEQLIADGQPLVIGVEADNPDLDRWVVLCGFDKRGDALVNDALAEDMDTVSQTLPRERLTRDWLARGGMALVFLPREK